MHTWWDLQKDQGRVLLMRRLLEPPSISTKLQHSQEIHWGLPWERQRQGRPPRPVCGAPGCTGPWCGCVCYLYRYGHVWWTRGRWHVTRECEVRWVEREGVDWVMSTGPENMHLWYKWKKNEDFKIVPFNDIMTIMNWIIFIWFPKYKGGILEINQLISNKSS